MKTLFTLIVTLLFVLTPVYGQALSDATGLVNRLDIQTGGHTFEVKTTSNFEIPDFEFDKDEKKLTLQISSGLENNLGEIILPQNLLGGNLTFHLNGQEHSPQVKTNAKVSFITLNFTGTGDNTLDIVGTEYLSGLTEIVTEMPTSDLVPLEDDYEELAYDTIIMVLLIISGLVGMIVLVNKRRK